MKSLRLALHWQMCIALFMGIICGWALGGFYNIWGVFINGIGNMFIHAISMIVIPLVFLSSCLSFSTVNRDSTMGNVVAKSFAFFLVTAIIAASIAVILTDALRPGVGASMPVLDDQGVSELLKKADEIASTTWIDKMVAIVPSNVFEALSTGDMLPIIFFSLMFGYFVNKMQAEKRSDVNRLLEGLLDAIMRMTTYIIRLMPIGVFAIVMVLIAKNTDDIVSKFRYIAFFVLVTWIALIVMGGVILPIMVSVGAKLSPIKHFKQIYSSLLVAFSTCSSYSALPLIINDTREKCGVSNNIASFTVPLGITFNKVGTIIYECVAVIFVAQAFDIELTTTQQISLIGASVVTVLGVPAVPMASVVVLAVLLKAMNLPNTYIGMFMAIDILCDMPKTLLNAYSVSCGAIIVAKSEGELLKI